MGEEAEPRTVFIFIEPYTSGDAYADDAIHYVDPIEEIYDINRSDPYHMDTSMQLAYDTFQNHTGGQIPTIGVLNAEQSASVPGASSELFYILDINAYNFLLTAQIIEAEVAGNPNNNYYVNSSFGTIFNTVVSSQYSSLLEEYRTNQSFEGALFSEISTLLGENDPLLQDLKDAISRGDENQGLLILREVNRAYLAQSVHYQEYVRITNDLVQNHNVRFFNAEANTGIGVSEDNHELMETLGLDEITAFAVSDGEISDDGTCVEPYSHDQMSYDNSVEVIFPHAPYDHNYYLSESNSFAAPEFMATIAAMDYNINAELGMRPDMNTLVEIMSGAELLGQNSENWQMNTDCDPARQQSYEDQYYNTLYTAVSNAMSVNGR